MRVLREMGGGLIIAIVSLILVIGGISLSLSEGAPTEQPTPSPLPPVFATSIELPTFTPLPLSTNTLEFPTPLITLSSEAGVTSTQAAPAVVCNPPAGWLAVAVTANDTLYTLAERYKTTTDILNTSNCLNNTQPAVGSLLYVPPVPTVTVIPCGPFAGWIKAYTVQPGDNLFRISLLYRTTVPQLQRANCMGGSTTIFVGQVLWVPNVPTSTSVATLVPFTSTVSPTATSTFVVTDSPVPSTATPSLTTAPPATPTPSITTFPTFTPTTPAAP